jgi:type VI secretion system protein ImpA
VDLAPLIQKLRPLAAFHAEAIGEPITAGAAHDAAAGPAAGSAAGGATGGAVAGAGAEIRSREDAVRELDRVCMYLERHEPANPAPLLIRRAQRLVQMNFLDILRDLAPEGMSSIEKIAGLPPAE